MTNNKFPSFEELFGELDFKKGDHAKSVYSPAAYLADLLQLMDDHFDKPEFDIRREDVKKMQLNGENTFTPVPYLDIVNDLLETKVSPGDSDKSVTAYNRLLDSYYPFNLPFDLNNERVSNLLNHLQVRPEDLYALFNLKENPNIVARSFLGLSQKMYDFLTDGNKISIHTSYGLASNEALRTIQPVSIFLAKSEITGVELRELLFQNLGEDELAEAKNFFINHGLENGFAALDKEEENIVWKIDVTDETTVLPPVTWYRRVRRFISLAQLSGLTFTELDLIIRSCCADIMSSSGDHNMKAFSPIMVQRIAIIKNLSQKNDWSIETTCTLFANIDTLGIGEEKVPMDYFDRIFNEPFSSVDKKYIAISTNQKIKYALAGYDELKPNPDFESIDNKHYRKRLSQALHISEKDLMFLHKTYVERGSFRFANSVDGLLLDQLNQLSYFFRMTKITESLEISIEDFFDLGHLLENDAAIRKYKQFKTLIHQEIQDLDVGLIMTRGSLEDRFWLVQIVMAIGQWMNDKQFTVEELKAILRGTFTDSESLDKEINKKINTLNSLQEQFNGLSLRPKVFLSELIDARASNVIFDTLKKDTFDLVSKKDDRLLKQQANEAELAAHEALNQLRTIRQKDFLGLGLAEKMQDKIYNNLVIKGFIKADGRLIEDAFPAEVENFKINSSSKDESTAVFELIHNLSKAEVGNGNGASNGNGSSQSVDEPAVFMSHFNGLKLNPARQAELYDNLIFNGYIDVEGTVLQPAFFVKKENIEKFEPNAKIDHHSEQVYELIQNNIARFNTESCKLNATVFADIPLKEIDLNDLIENLRFNEYIDENNVFVNKSELLDCKVEDFKLALVYYPHRHNILEQLKQVIKDFKAGFFTLTKDMLFEVADEIVAERIFNEVQQNYLQTDFFAEESIRFFSDEANVASFDLGQYFDSHTTGVVFRVIKKMIEVAEKFRVNVHDLFDLDFDEDEILDVLELLWKDGFLRPNGTMMADKVAHFLNVNNALDFKIPGFEDFNKDIFFILHNQAKAVDATVTEITQKIIELASAQEKLIFDVFQEGFEIPADQVKLICSHVFNEKEALVETIMLPILRSVNDNNRIVEEPKDKVLNTAWNRIRQFAVLAAKLNLSAAETDVIFRDQNLVGKFPETLQLPIGSNRFDALMKMDVDFSDESNQADIRECLLMFEFGKLSEGEGLGIPGHYALFDASTYNLYKVNQSIKDLSPFFEDINKFDAAFNDEKGNAWMISGRRFFCKEVAADEWIEKEKTLGEIDSNFVDVKTIDASFRNRDGKLFLFSGDQYFRFSGSLDQPDEGYPRKTKDNWVMEHNFTLPQECTEVFDAAFQSPDNRTFFFKENHFFDSDNYSEAKDINSVWAKIKSKFNDLKKIDAAFSFDGEVYVFSGDQYLRWTDQMEHSNANASQGTLRSIFSLLPDLPEDFNRGVDAVFVGQDNLLHAIKNNQGVRYTIARSATDDSDVPTISKVDEYFLIHPLSIPAPSVPSNGSGARPTFGNIKNNLKNTGKIDAAFTGLDGRVYLFSGDQYYRYSGTQYNYADEGYPKSIVGNWAGLTSVDAAFVLDGKTYLFSQEEMKFEGEDESEMEGATGNGTYIRYTTNDYTLVDEGYPQSPGDNWWNLPEALIESKFNAPDAVFVDHKQETYLFKGTQFIKYESAHRWWTEPQSIETEWGGMPAAFNKGIDSGFSGKDGRTYLFSNKKEQFIRYSDNQFNKVDDQFPKDIKEHWGNVKNNIEKNRKIDAALMMELLEENGESVTKNRVTYLFSGNQFFRYSSNSYDEVDEGYPKTTEKYLKDEARFGELEMALKEGLDAAFSDQRNIYLFKDEQSTVISDQAYKKYHKGTGLAIQSAFEEEGSIYMEFADGWKKMNNLEDETLRQTPTIPKAIRELESDDFKDELTAVLNGTDENIYLFKNGECYDSFLDKAYPTGEAWGVTNNKILLDNQIDTAFAGLDGKTYLFRGDQFVCYNADDRATKVIPQFIDKHPLSVKEHWAGLDNVYLAYTSDNFTYLMEAPDSRGVSRIACYATDDYMNETPKMKRGDIRYWGFPTIYLQQGFDKVNAAFCDDENLFLFGDKEFIQFNKEENVWTYPRPISQVWRELPFEDTDHLAVNAAFMGSDGTSYFFSSESYVAYENGVLRKDINEMSMQDINTRWGLQDNKMVIHNKVDAAVVFDNKKTFLFCDDQYVRYSTDDYRLVDAGYPKSMVANLRKEIEFTELPISFEKRLKTMQERNLSFDAVLANERQVYIIENQSLHAISRKISGQFDVARLGKLKNNIARLNMIDAALVDKFDRTYLFSGDQYVRYSDSNYEFVDDGYPKSINEVNLVRDGLARNADDNLFKLDAAFQNEDGHTYLLTGTSLYSSDETKNKTQVSSLLRASANPFSNASGRINAAFVAADGKAYFFMDGHYTCYGNVLDEIMEEGFPKSIRDNWGDLPIDYETGIDGAFVFEGRRYLVKGDNYVRYSKKDYGWIDQTYPQPFARKWNSSNDYLLGDVKNMVQYKFLQDNYRSDDFQINELFDLEKGYTKDPYQALADIFEWDIEEVKYLKVNKAFLQKQNDFEVNLNIELLLKMYQIFELSGKMAASPSAVRDLVWTNLYSTRPQVDKAANSLYLFLSWTVGTKDWNTLKNQIHDEMNLVKRDALLPFVVFNDKEVDSPRDLYEKMLIDVEMGAESKTSKIKEAISAIQLYFHRYFVNIEKPLINGEEDTKKQLLKSRWQWMKNYRVWEANRKVFLYPENYIRPELRDTKTPAFETLEQDLLQGEISEFAAQKAFKKYVDHYTEVSRLTIAGGYVYDDPVQDVDNNLILFGRTKSEPSKYYYRHATFFAGSTKSAKWQPWLEVGVSIDSDKVYPVFAFGRLWVFWSKIEKELKEEAPEKGEITTDDKDDGKIGVTSEQNTIDILRVYFSYYNLNKEWVPAQTLDISSTQEIRENQMIIHSDLFAESSVQLGDERHKNISIFCSYTLFDGTTVTKKKKTYHLTPELYVTTSNKSFRTSAAGEGIFNSLFDDSISPRKVVALNTFESSLDAPWYSFDHKGGSFLCKPTIPNLSERARDVINASPELGLPGWNQIDAAFSDDTGNNVFFNMRDDLYVSSEDMIEKSVSENLGLQSNSFTNPVKSDEPVVSGACVVEGDVYMFNEQEFIKYKNGKLNFVEEGYPKKANIKTFLIDIGFDFANLISLISESDAKKEVSGAVVDGGILKIHSHNSFNLDVDLKKRTIEKVDLTSLEAAYLNTDGTAVINKSQDYSAAFSFDGKLYLFKGDEFMEQSPIPDSFPAVDDFVATAKVRDHFGKVANSLTRGEGVSAAIKVGGKIHLFSGKQHFSYSNGLNNLVDSSFPRDVDHLFADFIESRVDAQIPNINRFPGVNIDLIDFEKPFRDIIETVEKVKLSAALGTGFTSGFTVGDISYLFSSTGHFFKFKNEGGNLKYLNENYEEVIGAWGNLPQQFKDNFDAKTSGGLITAAVNTAEKLFLFSGGQFVSFENGKKVGDVPIFYELKDGLFDLIRLTSSTGYTINEKLFVGGLKGMLNLRTQEIDETPRFDDKKSDPITIKINGDKIGDKSISSHLDFNSANGIYYWELFFHAPFLIGQSFNTAQKFDEAKSWYEYIFDPTEGHAYWKFLPFVTVDIQNIVNSTKHLQTELANNGLNVNVDTLLNNLNLHQQAFIGNEDLSAAALAQLEAHIKTELAPLYIELNNLINSTSTSTQNRDLSSRLKELLQIIEYLPERFEATQANTVAQLKTFQDDPFDPHAIADLRRVAYRKSIVMNYIDNLLDWGDMLFRQYSIESINEARMLYVLAFDLLGDKPENLGTKKREDDKNYSDLRNLTNGMEILLDLIALENNLPTANSDSGQSDKASDKIPQNLIQGVHSSIMDPYFYVPENDLFFDYYDRVSDRLHKIRQSLNILGIKQALPLFQPPIDPMSIVQAVSGGASVGAAAAGMGVAVPHYRFSFLMTKLRELVQKVSQFGGELLGAIEKKDAEKLSIMQSKHEADLLNLMTEVRKAQIEEIKMNKESLEISKKMAEERLTHHEELLKTGMLPTEIAQLSAQGVAAVLHGVSTIAKIAATFGSAIPDALVGPFIMGVKVGGTQAGAVANTIADVSSTAAEGLSILGELLGVTAQHQRMIEDWTLAKDTAVLEIDQIEIQLMGAEVQLQVAQYELNIHKKEIENQKQVADFIKNKFSNDQLYQWMISQLSGIYYQTYKMAYDMAKSAEKAFVYERGVKASKVNFVNGMYWNSNYKGLLAGEKLGLDIDRMEKAYIETNQRRFEITKSVSLLDLDPMAFLDLKTKGSCMISLPEALFDYDFQGHYCRQIKTISISFDIPEGQTVNATLTQLSHKTILEPDPKAVKFLLNPKDAEPTTIRSNWRANQQIALSKVDEYEDNNGLFELRFDDERYLPFEGTGAVSNWLLEINGRRGSFNPDELVDVLVNIKYTALQGGQVFGDAVRGMLKPYQTVKFIDLNFDFHNEWLAFLANDNDTLDLDVSRELFPAMANGKVTGIFARLDLLEKANISLILNKDDSMQLKDQKFTETPGLSISSKGSKWTLKVKGDKKKLKNVLLLAAYKAKV